MKITHITSVHPWNDARIFHKMATAAAASGHEVHLVALDGDPRVFRSNGVTVHLLDRSPFRSSRLRRAQH